jgi:uncharacterized protein (DUF4415 family)
MTRIPPRQPAHQSPRPPRLTKTQRLARERLQRHATELGRFDPYDWDVSQIVPEAWATLEQDIDVREKKVKVTLRLDESVAKFFRAQGQGYQARINHVLGTYAQMKIAELAITERKVDALLAARKAGLSEEAQMAAWRDTK